MATPTSSSELRSIGQLAADLQANPSQITAVIERLGLRAALILNGRAFYTQASVNVLRAALGQNREAPHG